MFKTNIIIITIVLFYCVFVVYGAQYEGDSCEENGKQGTCFKAMKCQSAIESIQNKIYPKICGFDKTDPIVCCFSKPGDVINLPPATPEPTTTVSTNTNIESRYGECQPIPVPTAKKTGRKAFDKCVEYQEKYVYPCTRSMSILGSYSRSKNCHHDAEQLIISGEDAGRDEFPHMAMVRYGFDNETKKYLCGGSIISENFVLTAAHCIAPAPLVDITHVIVGALTLTEADNKLNRYVVIQRIKHPEYKSPQKYNDIALLQTERNMKLSQFLVPACLPTANVEDDKVIATGWGQTNYRDATSVSEILQRVIIYKFDKEECTAKFTPHRHLENGIDHKTQFCYGDRNQSRDTCQGDSGGPIQIKNQQIYCMYTIVGLTSYGKRCGYPGDPAIYTRIADYVPWIESIVWP